MNDKTMVPGHAPANPPQECPQAAALPPHEGGVKTWGGTAPSQKSTANAAAAHDASWEDEIDFAALFVPLWRGKLKLAGAAILAGIAGYGASWLVPPNFTSTATFLPPQQQQSVAASALATLGVLSGLGGAGTKNPAEEYVALMQSVTVSDRMIDRFKLTAEYDTKYRQNTRKALAKHTEFTIGKKDGLINVSVTDKDKQVAADMANQYVEELRRMTSVLAVSEAQQRRVFFEKQMQDTQAKLITAQTALQLSGFGPGALRAEPQAAAEQYAQLRAQATGAEVKLQALRTALSESAPEVRQQAAQLDALRSKLAVIESSTKPDPTAPDYVTKYREFKYQETLFDLMSKQYEIARVDEAREGALIQVVDPALPAELKSSPRRSIYTLVAAVLGLLGAAAALIAGNRRTLRAAN